MCFLKDLFTNLKFNFVKIFIILKVWCFELLKVLKFSFLEEENNINFNKFLVGIFIGEEGKRIKLIC